ncbi:Tannase/feruloyl esterase [Podospora didyma]|uniref:Carboxylic ester hydrolase n=1 Tax=Podospora didyma TaxID=330526 RepID=A0AAE0U0V6_9PEZI|nr:Tannase/feruloyl esterase [Podospora didyma]
MPSLLRTLAAAALTVSSVVICVTTLDQVCTPGYAHAALPAPGFYPGITIDTTSISTSIVTNRTVKSDWFPASTISYCNVTFAYSHNGIPNDRVHVTYWVPSPDTFQNRYVSTGGGGLAINSASSSIPTGVIAGAVSGLTDGGFGSFTTQWDAVFLLADGTINWQSVHMFGYQAHRELAVLGKEFTRKLFRLTSTQKLYSYYQGCSEGGREGWSQLQRFADQFDGAAIGAPAFRYGQQQVNHLTSNVVEQTLGYFPPPCELEKIVNLTVAACDGLDGRLDGIIARSDLWGVGPPPGGPLLRQRQFSGGGPTPAQNGTVTAKAIAVAQTILNGLHDSQGRLVYLSYALGASFADGKTSYNATSKTWGLSISGLGGEWVRRFLQLHPENTLPTLQNVTYDTLKEWMILGQNRYTDTLQTTYPDLSPLKAAGAKVIHVHGEADDSIPVGSSVHYYNSVRSAMYPQLSYNASVVALDEFYRLYLVPGGAHCGPGRSAPGGGPWPQTTLQTVMEWVEKGVAPARLSATGGGIDELCKWPLRPLWLAGKMECVYDQASIDTWKHDFDAYNTPLY